MFKQNICLLLLFCTCFALQGVKEEALANPTPNQNKYNSIILKICQRLLSTKFKYNRDSVIEDYFAKLPENDEKRYLRQIISLNEIKFFLENTTFSNGKNNHLKGKLLQEIEREQNSTPKQHITQKSPWHKINTDPNLRGMKLLRTLNGI